MANVAAVVLADTCTSQRAYANISFKTPARDCPAETPLIGPVST